MENKKTWCIKLNSAFQRTLRIYVPAILLLLLYPLFIYFPFKASHGRRLIVCGDMRIDMTDEK